MTIEVKENHSRATKQARFIDSFNDVALDVSNNAIAKGWWDEERNDGELLALVHSEVSEILEALRKDDPPDDKCPEFNNAEVEAADVIIRLMDMGVARGWRIAEAVIAKHEFNKSRPYKHGKNF